MTPDSDTYGHILLNGALWWVILFGIPSVVWAWKKFFRWIDRRCEQSINLHIHRALYPNVRVLDIPQQKRSAR